ncbi:MAG: cobalamin B12-binding domain-containing protein [Thaumarchaeota archaeon]|nr:cobalamin B12-binding domain-containing protein [Nitrososphaerota archaeon]
MLAQLMERASHQTLYLQASVSSEVLDALASDSDTVIFISALPPFAFSETRTICQRVRSHLPHNRIIIGLWNPIEDPDQPHDLIVERFGNGKPTVVVSTLAQAVRQVTQWHHEVSNRPMRM